MLKSYLKSLSEETQVSSKTELDTNSTVSAEIIKTPEVAAESRKENATLSDESIKGDNSDTLSGCIDNVNKSSANVDPESPGIANKRELNLMASESASSERNDQSTSDNDDDNDTADDDDDDDDVDESDAIVNRFEFLLDTDETTETPLDEQSSTCDKTNCLKSTASDYEAGPSEVSVSQEAPSRRKKTKRKQRRRQIASINESINDADDDFDVLSTELHESPHDQVENGTNKSTAMNPLNMRVERKYLNYSTELKLKSLSASEAALFKRTLTTRNNHNVSYSANKLCLGNGSRYPSLSKSDASMQFDDDNPSAEHVLGVTHAFPSEKSSKKATRNLCNMHLFKIVHHERYQQMQRQLLVLVSKVDYELGNKLVAILSSYPCHVETLLQLACMVESSDEETSSVLTERAISALESIFHPRFLASSNACRLDYRRRENRVYFIALLKHAQFISQVHKCPRAAFELCKSLYTIDPLNDPLASLLILDHYALACGQYSWIIETYQQSVQDKSIKDKLNHLPNWPYSVALAAYLSKQYSLADQLINEALTLFPSMLRHLLDQCSVEPDEDLKNCEYFDFKKASNHLPKSLDLLILLYTRRSSCHWLADRKIMIWLESRVRSFVQTYKNTASQCNLKSNESFFRRNPLPAKNITRHIVLSGISSLIEKLTDPAIVTKYFDPNPPTDEIESYNLSSVRGAGEANASATSDSVLSLFLKSLLPDYSVTSQSIKQAVARESTHPPTLTNSNNVQAALTDESPASSADNLKSSVSSVLSAVRDLLSSMDPQDDSVNGDSSARASHATARNEE